MVLTAETSLNGSHERQSLLLWIRPNFAFHPFCKEKIPGAHSFRSLQRVDNNELLLVTARQVNHRNQHGHCALDAQFRTHHHVRFIENSSVHGPFVIGRIQFTDQHIPFLGGQNRPPRCLHLDGLGFVRFRHEWPHAPLCSTTKRLKIQLINDWIIRLDYNWFTQNGLLATIIPVF